jgi:sulfopropanediol 3-dehydrogenase
MMGTESAVAPRLPEMRLDGQHALVTVGPISPALLITTSESLGRDVLAEVDRQLDTLPSGSAAGEAWRDYGALALVEDREAAAALADEWAPEHLAYSDKAIGTNHVLPTGRAARYTGGPWVARLLKTLTYQRVTPDEGTRLVGPPTRDICHAENMWAHAITVDKRLERLADDRRRRAGDRPA